MKNIYPFYNRQNELRELLNSFEQQVIRQHKTLSYVTRGKKEIGKTRLIQEFINKIQGIEYLSEIPHFDVKKQVITYKCSKGLEQPYNAFINITKEIYNTTKWLNILIKSFRVGLSFFGINDIVDALSDFNEAVKKTKNNEKKQIKEAKLFNRYRKFIKKRSRKIPLIIFIQNIQWIDSFSLTLIKKLIKNSTNMWGMIILEEDNNDIDEKVHNELNNLIFENKLDKLEVNPLDNSFPKQLLKNKFGEVFFSSREIDLLYAVSEGCPGKLINYIEHTCISQGWIREENGIWHKVNDFYEKIKPAKQRLTDVIITMFEDKVLSPSEYNTLLHMASVWGMQKETVESAIIMIREIIEYNYKIISNLGPGIIGKNSFLVSDNKDNRYIVEYVKNYSDEKKIMKIEKRSIIHKNLLEAHDIKISKDGILIIWNYFESNPDRREMIEAFENQIKHTVEKFKAISEGLSELHKNNIFHGYIKPETIIENKNGEYQLATFNNNLLKYILNLKDETYPDIQYLSPEHLNKQKIGMYSDIFSLGILLYKSLTNRFPFYGNTTNDLMHAFKNNKVKFNGPFLALIPEKLKAIIKKCLEYNPDKRYKNAMELAEDLNKVPVKPLDNKSQITITTPSSPHSNKRRNKKMSKIIITIILAIAIFGYSGYYFGLFNSKTKSIKKEVVIHVSARDFTTNNNEKIKPEVIQYLLMDDLMQSSNAVVKTQGQFNKSYPDTKTVNFLPATFVDVLLTNRDFSHELKISVTTNNKNSSSIKTKTIDFTDPSQLVEGEICTLTKFILGKNKLRKTLFTNSWDAFINFYHGEIAWSKVDMTKALQYLNSAVSIDTNFVLAKLRLAEVYRFEGNNQLSIHYLNSVIPNTKYLSRVDSLSAMALKHKLNGNFWAAIHNLRDITNFLSARKMPYYNLAEAYFEISAIKDAKVNYQKTLDLDNDFAPAINHYAYCFSQTGDHKTALKYFRKYIKLDSSANAFDSYGDGLMAAGKLDSAEWAKKQGLKLNPKLEYLYNSLSYIQVRKGEFDRAEENINHYLNLEHSPELHAEGLVNKALIYYFKGNLKQALDTCLKAELAYDTFDISTRNHKVHWLLTQIYLYNKNYSKANKELNQMHELINKYHISSINYNEILKYYLHCKAIKYYLNNQLDKVVEIANIFNTQLKNKIKDWSTPYDQAFFFTEFGKLFIMNNDTTNAEYYLKKAISYNPNYALAHYYFYDLYFKQKRFKKAIYYGNTFIKLWHTADSNILEVNKDTIIDNISIPNIELKLNNSLSN